MSGWFDAMNPRAVLPISQSLTLAYSFGKSVSHKTFREKTELLNRVDGTVNDEQRGVESCEMLDRLMRSGYVWLPVLAQLLEELPPLPLMKLCVEVFYGTIEPHHAADSPAAERYRVAELGIMRENLIRNLSKLDVMLTAIIDPVRCPEYDIEAELGDWTLAHTHHRRRIVASNIDRRGEGHPSGVPGSHHPIAAHESRTHQGRPEHHEIQPAPFFTCVAKVLYQIIAANPNPKSLTPKHHCPRSGSSIGLARREFGHHHHQSHHQSQSHHQAHPLPRPVHLS